jgi:acetyl-CoA C-acetyltransferase
MGSTVALPQSAGMALPFGQGWRDWCGDQEISQFRGAQLMCEKWGIRRAELEEFSLRSHEKAITAIDEGRFDREITPPAAS